MNEPRKWNERPTASEDVQHATQLLSETVHQTLDLDSLYRQFHSIIEGLMPAENFSLVLQEPGGERQFYAYQVDAFDTHPAPRAMNSGLYGYVMQTGNALLANRQSMTDPKNPWRLQSGTPPAVWLGVPLILQNHTIGVMAVQDYRDPEAYGDKEKQILTFVARQVALAIDLKRADQALRRRTEQMSRHRQALLDLARLEKSDFGHAIGIICASAATASQIARVGYWSLLNQPARLVCERLYLLDPGRDDPARSGAQIASDQCPSYFAALATKQPIVAHRAETHPATRELVVPYLRPLGITSMLDVPVWLHGQVVGVLCHEHIGPPRQWSAEEIDFAASLATMISLSIEAAQRARSEQALRESEQKFRALFEASGQGVMLHDDHAFLEINPAAARLLGYDNPADILGRHPAELSPPTQPDGTPSDRLAADHIQRCLNHGKTRFEWVSRTAHGEDVLLDVILTRVEMNGRFLIQAVLDDIGERKKAEAELHRALAREKELSQLKSSFVSMVSHEFRTPLGIIMSSTEILRDYLERLDPDERRHHLDSITKNTRRMSGLMEEVLVLGRLDAGNMDFQPLPVDIAVICERITDEIRSATSQRCPIRLCLSDANGDAHVDERLFRHIFSNLLVNAVKYSPPGSPVRWTIHREDHEAVFEVIDRGIGIPEGDRAWLFKAFHRGRNVGNESGSGLGLVIVKRCVDLHRGAIRVESAVGQGTTVTVRLPVFA